MTASTPDASDATRARDADRNLAIDLIDAAYSDGQLTSTEREERCDRVLATETLGDLRTLTRDLQTPVVAPGVLRRRRRLVPIAVTSVVAAGIVVGVIIANGGDEDSPAQQKVQSAVPSVEPEQTKAPDPAKKKPKPLHYTLTPQGVENFVTAYRKEFGRTKAVAFGFDRDSVNVIRRGRGGEVAFWRYVDDGFVDAGYSGREFEPGNVDIADFNVKAAFRNLERIKDRLGLKRFPRLGMSVLVASGQKGVWLVAGKESTNLSECQADWMTLDGTVEQTGTACPLS